MFRMFSGAKVTGANCHGQKQTIYVKCQALFKINAALVTFTCLFPSMEVYLFFFFWIRSFGKSSVVLYRFCFSDLNYYIILLFLP